MDELNETTRILNDKAIDQLTKSRNEEIVKILKLRLVLRELKDMKVEKLNLTDFDDIKHAQKVLTVADYLNLNEKDDDCLLNMSELRNTSLTSYSDRKAVREYLLAQLPHRLQPIAELGAKMRKELPDVFLDSNFITTETTSAATAFNANSTEVKIITCEKQRRANYEKYAKVLQRKCELLKTAAKLKLGPYLNNELELLYAQARLNQIKSNVLRSFFINEYVNSTEHSLKALKEVEGYVDQELEKFEKLNKTEKK